MRNIFFLFSGAVLLFYGCVSRDISPDAGEITDLEIEDISHLVTDAGGDLSTDISEDIIKCESGIAGIYGPYNRVEVSFSAEIFPFPNDYYTIKDPSSPTGIRLNYPENVFLNGINELMGFPTYPFLVARFVMREDPEGKYVITPIVIEKHNKMKFSEDFLFLLPVDVLLDNTDVNQIEKSLVPLEIHSNNMGSIFA